MAENCEVTNALFKIANIRDNIKPLKAMGVGTMASVWEEVNYEEDTLLD